MSYLEGMERRYAVIAIGGNAILRKGDPADPATQMANIRCAVDNLACALSRYYAFALTHGNGPQVGNDLIRSYSAYRMEGLPELGLADCVANTQGCIGHWIIREMKNHPRFSSIPTTCLLTHVLVDKNEFSKAEHVKYVGPWRPNDDKTRAELDSRGIEYRIPDGQTEKLRRVVPSPMPIEILEFEIIARLLESGFISICCGGGGIPVYDPDWKKGESPGATRHILQSEVVIDKDRASSLLASKLLNHYDGVDVELVILMEAQGLFRDARCREEDFIDRMTLNELEEFIRNNDLEKGTIRPKLEAIRDFLAAGGKRAFLGPLSDFSSIFNPDNRTGTVFLQSEQLAFKPKK